MLLKSLPKKLAWLVSHPEFREHPLQVTARVAQWEYFRLRGRPVDLRLGQFKIRARASDGMGRMICYFGEAADEIFSFLTRHLRPGMTFVDVGANIGTHSVFAAYLVGSLGKVFSFEPDPATSRVLKENLSLNKITNAVVEECCLSDSNGISVLHLNMDSAKTSLVREGTTQIEVATKTLDSALPEGTAVDFLKIDVEGADYAVLRGAEAMFASRPPSFVIIEVTQHADDISAFLRAHEYRLFTVDSRSLELKELQVLPDTLFNCYAVHASAPL